MNGFQTSFLSRFDKKLFSTTDANKTRLKMLKIVAKGMLNFQRDRNLILQHSKLRYMLGYKLSKFSPLLDIYTYEFVLAAHDCYERWQQSQDVHVAQIAPLEVKYEEDEIIVHDQSYDDFEDDSTEVEENDNFEDEVGNNEEQGVETTNYMMCKQEMHPCYRLPGESNPFFKCNDYILLGGGKNFDKRKTKRKKKKPQQQAQKRRNGTIELYNPGTRGNEFPLLRNNMQPTTLVQDFIYDISSTPFNNPGGAITGEVFQSNDGFDWLSSILTAAMQFLNYRFKTHGKAKVLTFKIHLTFCNLEQTEIDLHFFSSPESLTSLFASKAAIEAAAATGIYRGGRIMSEQYGKSSKVTFCDTIKPGHVIGNMVQYRASDDYSFTQSSGPPRITNYGWLAVSPINTMSTGFTRRVHIEARILFYDMLTLSANLTSIKPKPENWVCPRSQRDSKTSGE